MERKHLLAASFALGLAGIPLVATADKIELTGVVRDFVVAHPDMENPNKKFGVATGLVKTDLGADGKPVLVDNHDGVRGMISSRASFNQWFRDTPGVNIAIPYTIALDNGQDEPGGTYKFAVEKPNYFFPIDGQGFGDKARDANGHYRNFYFTYEIKTEFRYIDPKARNYAMVFTFTGDDDVWVYINGKLAVDIGGVHGQASRSVNLDEKAAQLGLEPGEMYPLDFFFAERHTTESNFRIETTLLLQGIPPTTISPLYD